MPFRSGRHRQPGRARDALHQRRGRTQPRRSATSSRASRSYTEPDRHAWFVREADEAVCIGPATTFDPLLGRTRSRLSRLRRARTCVGRGPGRGRLGRVGIRGRACRVRGPLRQARRRLHRPLGRRDATGRRQDRQQAIGRRGRAPRRAVERRAGRPTSTQPSTVAARVGYPLFIKATAGGGGRGIRRVDGARGVGRRLRGGAYGSSAGVRRSRPCSSNGRSPTLVTSRYRLIADHHGSVWAVGLRDCTLQRRHQKVIEESACTLLDAEPGTRDPRGGGRTVPARRVHQRRHGRVPVLAGTRTPSTSWR